MISKFHFTLFLVLNFFSGMAQGDNAPEAVQPEVTDATKCEEAFFQYQYKKNDKPVIELGLFSQSDSYFFNILGTYSDTLKVTGQIPFRIDHYKRTVEKLIRSSFSNKVTLFAVHYEFNREQYCAENGEKAKSKQVLIPCGYTLYIDPIVKANAGQSPYEDSCIQEKL